MSANSVLQRNKYFHEHRGLFIEPSETHFCPGWHFTLPHVTPIGSVQI